MVSSLTNQIAQDGRFDRIETLVVDYVVNTGVAPAIVIDMTVRLAGSNQVVPISFSVKYS
jgi:hypothetical protein